MDCAVKKLHTATDLIQIQRITHMKRDENITFFCINNLTQRHCVREFQPDN